MSDASQDPLANIAPLQISKGRFRRLKISLAAGVVFLLMLGVLLPSLCKSSETANRIKCANNLRQIGMAIKQYASEHGGRYPDSFATLILSADLTAATFNCPSTVTQPAPGDTPQAVAAHLGEDQYESYVYVGKGLTADRVNADTVIAYDLPSNHGLAGNVLYGDGRVEFLDESVVKEIDERSKAGRLPVTMPSGQ